MEKTKQYLSLDPMCKFNLSSDTSSMIYRYWENNEGVFINSPEKIGEDFGITSRRLGIIVRENSALIIKRENCAWCQTSLDESHYSQYSVKARLAQLRIRSIDHIRCDICRLNHMKQENHRRSELTKLNKINNGD